MSKLELSSTSPHHIFKKEEAKRKHIIEVHRGKFYTALKEAFPELTKTEARIMKLRYGLTGGKPLEYHQIAANDGTSKSIIANIHDEAITKLRQHEPLTEIAKRYQSDRTVRSAFTTYRGPTPNGMLLGNIFANLTPEEKALPPEPKDEAIELFVREDVKTPTEDVPNQTTVEKPKRRQHFPQIKDIWDAANEEEKEELLERLTKKQRKVLHARLGDGDGPRSQPEAVRLVGNTRKSFSRIEKEILRRFSTTPSSPENTDVQLDAPTEETNEYPQKRRISFEEAFAQTSAEEQEAFFQNLTPRQEQIAKLCLNLSTNEIAQLLDRSVGYIAFTKNLLKNKLHQLKEEQ